MQKIDSKFSRMLRLTPALGVLVLSLLAPRPAIPEEREHSWEFSALAGNTFYGNENRIANEYHYGVRVGWYFLPAFEVEVQYMQTDPADLQDADSTLISDATVFTNPAYKDLKFDSRSYTARLLINPRNERRRLKPYILFGAGVLEFNSDPRLKDSEEGDLAAKIVTVGGGLRQRLTAHMAFRAEFESEYAVSEVYHNEHINLGLTWVFGGGAPADSDGDGVLDIRDRCPDTPQGALVDKHDGCPWDLDSDGIMEGIDICPETPRGWPVDERGCPLDSDGDKVPDGTDNCADTPQGAIVDARGCPVDSDGDTVLDGIDRCPGTPLGAYVDAPDSETPGCPHDSDSDSVFDGIDQCPLTPPGAWVDERGCPRDSDGDRVLDGIDQCPDSPPGERLDREGCPRVRIDKAEPQILQNVKFHAEGLYPGSDAWLMLLVEAAKYWTDIKFEVGVYTDSEGGEAANRQAARHRAQVVKAFLVEHGIDAKRIVERAYGAVNFIADNATEEGRDRNRRVEVKYVSGDVRKHAKPEAGAPSPELLEEKAQPAAAPAPQAKPSEGAPEATPGEEEARPQEQPPPEEGAPPEEAAPSEEATPPEEAASPEELAPSEQAGPEQPAAGPEEEEPAPDDSDSEAEEPPGD